MTNPILHVGHCSECGAVVYTGQKVPYFQSKAIDRRYADLHEQWHRQLDKRLKYAESVGRTGDMANTLLG
jgi:hypothetical protein